MRHLQFRLALFGLAAIRGMCCFPGGLSLCWADSVCIGNEGEVGVMRRRKPVSFVQHKSLARLTCASKAPRKGRCSFLLHFSTFGRWVHAGILFGRFLFLVLWRPRRVGSHATCCGCGPFCSKAKSPSIHSPMPLL